MIYVYIYIYIHNHNLKRKHINKRDITLNNKQYLVSDV